MKKVLNSFLFLVGFVFLIQEMASAAVYGPARSSGSFTISWDVVEETPRVSVLGYTVIEKSGGSSVKRFMSGTRLSLTKVVNGKFQFAVSARLDRCFPPNYECREYVISLGEVTVVVAIPLPAAPEVVLAPASDVDGIYTVSWRAVSGLVDSYQLQERKDNGGWKTLLSSTALSMAMSGKTSGVYGYRVRACNVSGCGQYTTVKTVSVVTRPAAPGVINLVAESTDGHYTLSWGHAAHAQYYELSENFNAARWSGFVTVGNVTEKIFTNKNNGSYRYRIRGCRTGGCGDYVTSSAILVNRTPAVKVMFIHADLLGSPVIETDSSGKILTGKYKKSFQGVVSGDMSI